MEQDGIDLAGMVPEALHKVRAPFKLAGSAGIFPGSEQCIGAKVGFMTVTISSPGTKHFVKSQVPCFVQGVVFELTRNNTHLFHGPPALTRGVLKEADQNCLPGVG